MLCFSASACQLGLSSKGSCTTAKVVCIFAMALLNSSFIITKLRINILYCMSLMANNAT